MKSTWQSTKDVADDARQYISPDPEIDTDAYQFENPNQEKLAVLFTPVDEPLGKLIRYVEVQDVFPPDEWLQALLLRFPWVDGVLVADEDGNIKRRLPQIPVKRFSAPLVFDAYWRGTFLKTVLDEPDLGPELYMGTPIFSDVTFRGLIVASFDPRVLFQFCPSPEDLILLQPGGGVWTPDESVDREGLLALDWPTLLEDDVYGQVKVGDKYYTWLARYIGQDAFVYATESADPSSPVNGSNWLPF